MKPLEYKGVEIIEANIREQAARGYYCRTAYISDRC